MKCIYTCTIIVVVTISVLSKPNVFLSSAARFGHLGVVVWLVESEGCSVLDQAQNGVTAVHLAAAKGSINCLKWLTQQNPR